MVLKIDTLLLGGYEMKSKENLLLSALGIMFEHLRHVEAERRQFFYFHTLLITAFLSTSPVLWSMWKGVVVILVYFLSAFSLIIYYYNLRANANISEHVTVIQWISEKLGLIKKMEESEKEHLKLKLKKLGVKEIKEYSFFKDVYICIPSPLSISIHEVVFTSFPRFLTSVFFATANVLAVWCLIVEILRIVGLDVIVMLFILMLAALLSFAWMWRHCGRKLRQIKRESLVYKKVRKPKEIVTWSETG
ncbi:MAG: hypothetical protein QXG76_03495 [Candidatus Bathyarchaeia archaeon]